MTVSILSKAIAVFLCVGLSSSSLAGNRQWSLDGPTHPELSVIGGDAMEAPGIRGQSLKLDGLSILQVKDSADATHHEDGFTFAVWVNPYSTQNGQQMIAAKNRYSLNEREWGVMIDKDGRYCLYVKQVAWSTLASETAPTIGRWQHVAVAISDKVATMWINGQESGSIKLDQPIPRTKAPLTFGGVNDNGRIWQNLHGALDEAVLFERALEKNEIATLYQQHRAGAAVATEHTPPKEQVYTLWSGEPIPTDLTEIPFVEGMTHQTLHDARTCDYRFLHGAAIIHHKGTFFANWANSPKNENQQFETMQGRRSSDGGKSWSDVEMIAPGFEGLERHSHGVYLENDGQLWTFAARFGLGTEARRFPGLSAEAFVLNERTNAWESQGKVMENCWPYDEPIKMENGNYITGGQDKDGLPVVAISDGDNLLKWTSVLIPYPPKLAPSFAETSVWAEGKRVTAIIRGGADVAWVATSDDYGHTWAKAQPSNMPMPRAKCYFGRLSTGQLYLLSNLKDRDTLCISVSRPGEKALSAIWHIRHGQSIPPRFQGHAKSKQWSYPYGYEHDGKLYVVYSIGKEDCGLTVIPIASLTPES